MCFYIDYYLKVKSTKSLPKITCKIKLTSI